MHGALTEMRHVCVLILPSKSRPVTAIGHSVTDVVPETCLVTAMVPLQARVVPSTTCDRRFLGGSIGVAVTRIRCGGSAFGTRKNRSDTGAARFATVAV